MTDLTDTLMMSGFCAFPETAHPDESHARCHDKGGGNRARPGKEFQPCPCPCHYPGAFDPNERFECSGCGREIMEAPLWPPDEDGDIRYTHVDRTGRATGEDCA